MFFENFRENYNIIDIVSCKRFIGSKNRVYYILNVGWRFFIAHNSYVRSFKITIAHDYKLLSVLLGYTLLIEEVGTVHNVNVFII